MITSPNKMRRAAIVALLLAGAAVPAIGQDKPESLLPEGFGDPVAPARDVAPVPAPTRAAVEPVQPAIANVVGAESLGNSVETDPAEEAAAAVDLSNYELPEFARHSLTQVGVRASGNTPYPANAFGATDGRYLQKLLRRLDAPVASRWASIALRRALMSPLHTPANINGADFAAERAWVLLRMGEANAARGVVNDVDTDNYSTLLYQIAMQTALATADPAAMCSIADGGARIVNQRGWKLAQAFCAGLDGKPTEAGQLLTQARAGTPQGDLDNLLAEKVLGTGAQGRRAVTIEWPTVQNLTAWRWGLATAMGEEVPASLYATAGPQVRYWQALAPSIAPAARAASAELAASAGVFSSAGLVDLYSEIAQDGEASGAEAGVARSLRTAYTDGDIGNRVKAIHALWAEAATSRTRYARLILTARAASWIPARADIVEPEKLIASMLSAGMETPAMEWKSVVQRGSEGWGLLALADPAISMRVAYGDLDSYSDVAGRRRAQLMLAGLAGLNRLDTADAERGAQALDVRIGASNAWTRAIDTAGKRGDAGTVTLLAAVGMQSRSWDAVTPEALFHIVSAMRAAGLSSYARMIAVEAVTRAA